MEDNQEFVLEMEDLLAQKCKLIEEVLLERIHENFAIYYKSVQTVFNVLVRKSLLSEDPYKYEQKISEITIPDQGDVAENDKGMQMSIRISNFESQLEFLNHYYQFSIEFLNMKRIKTLASLATYIKWEGGPTSSDPNTSILFEMINKIPMESDQVSHGILKSAVQGLAKHTKLILRDLKELSSYHREAYKQDIRQAVIPELDLDQKGYLENPEGAIKRVRQKYTAIKKGTPFYSDLVKEMLEELYSENGSQLQQELLSKYQSKEKKRVKKKEVTHKSLLTDALKILASGGIYLDQAMTKVRSNFNILENKKESFGEKFKKWLKNMVSKEQGKFIMDLEIFEEETSLSKTVRIDFNAFNEKVSKQGRLLQACGTEMSQTFQKLKAASEEELFKYIADRVVDLQKTCSFLNPIETYLKTEATRDQRGKLASLDKDIENIKSCIKRTNSKRFDYSTRMEEQEQLKRLGIDN
ncbi:MAG: hypothetical protein JEY99_06150 [Spirochaetales bacterium]|nr:hypothetical protein [Spirochaetales bacterium]